MKLVAKLMLLSVLMGLIVGGVSAASSGASDDLAGTTGAVAAPAQAVMNLPSTGGSGVGLTGYNTFTSISAFKVVGSTVTKIVINPATGGTINMGTRDIVIFYAKGTYYGPSGTYGLMDFWDRTGAYPTPTPKLIAGMPLARSTTETKLFVPPLWFNGGNTGTYNMQFELYGGGQVALVPITVVVA